MYFPVKTETECVNTRLELYETWVMFKCEKNILFRTVIQKLDITVVYNPGPDPVFFFLLLAHFSVFHALRDNTTTCKKNKLVYDHPVKCKVLKNTLDNPHIKV